MPANSANSNKRFSIKYLRSQEGRKEGKEKAIQFEVYCASIQTQLTGEETAAVIAHCYFFLGAGGGGGETPPSRPPILFGC